MISSFFLFSSNISSRVMSRLSMYERSSVSFFLPKTFTGSSAKDLNAVELVNDDVFVTKASAVGAVRTATTRARRSVKREIDIMMLVNDSESDLCHDEMLRPTMMHDVTIHETDVPDWFDIRFSAEADKDCRCAS